MGGGSFNRRACRTELCADHASSSLTLVALSTDQHRTFGGVGRSGTHRRGSGSLARPLCNAAAVSHCGLFFSDRIVAPTRLIVFDRRRKSLSTPCRAPV